MSWIYFGKNKRGGLIAHRGIINYKIEKNGWEMFYALLPLQTNTTSGKQPVFLGGEKYFMYNGEIFNDDIWNSDTSFLRDLFSGKNKEEVKNIIKNQAMKRNGFQSIVRVDFETEDILVYTDVLGKKILYINDQNEISSEIKPLKSNTITLDYSYLGEIKRFGYNINDKTPYLGIRRFLPGKIYDGKIGSFFYNYSITEINHDAVEIPERNLEKLIEKAVKRRLKTRDPSKKIGCLVSGGLDSSLLVYYLEKYKENKEILYYFINNGNDQIYIKDLKSFFPNINIIEIEEENLDLKEVLEVNETPVDLGSVFPTYQLLSSARKINYEEPSIMFTGDWADEFFKWYKRHKEDFDYTMHDVYNELSYYHLVKQDKLFSAFKFENRSPFLDLDLLKYIKTFSIKKFKEDLKEIAKGKIPDSIINREKEPLLVDQIKKDKIEHRNKLINTFIQLNS